MINSVAYVVEYEGNYYLHYKTTNTGQAMLINSEGKVLKNPVPTYNLRKIKKIKAKEVKGVRYADTRMGVFNLKTGRHIKSQAVLNQLKA